MGTELEKRFDDPPRSFSPVPIWWWSGERLDPERLRWQLERFAQGGIYNLVVMNLAPTGPMFAPSILERNFQDPCPLTTEISVKRQKVASILARPLQDGPTVSRKPVTPTGRLGHRPRHRRPMLQAAASARSSRWRGSGSGCSIKSKVTNRSRVVVT